MAKPSTLDELLFEAANPFEQLLATFTFEDDSVASKIKAILERSKVIKALMLQADKEGKTETSALNKFLTDKVRDHRATNSPEAKRVLDFVLDKRERSACLWLIDNPEQFAWVRKNKPKVLETKGMQREWGTFRDKSIKEQMAAAPKAEREKVVATLASDFFTTSEAVEARIEAFAEAAKKKAEKEADQPAPTPVPTPDINPVMILRDWLLEANEKELDAIQTLLDERKARLGVPQRQPAAVASGFADVAQAPLPATRICTADEAVNDMGNAEPCWFGEHAPCARVYSHTGTLRIYRLTDEAKVIIPFTGEMTAAKLRAACGSKEVRAFVKEANWKLPASADIQFWIMRVHNDGTTT